MLIFLDTEFTDFLDCDLISIGMISTGGHEFYYERNDFNQKWCSEFVREGILPMLYKQPNVGNKSECASAVREWLNALPYERIVFVIDFYTDIQLLEDLLDKDYGSKVPTGQYHLPVTYIQHIAAEVEANREFVVGSEEFYEQKRGVRHHALDDAKANREGWIAVMHKAGVF